jgi:mannose-6-phosphate isomerase-like protein (cupin superfamily)
MSPVAKVPEKVSLEGAFASFNEYWQPHLAGNVNETAVKLAKLQGAFDWHHHAQEDELFLVVKGRLRMGLRDGDTILPPVDLDEGEMLIVPAGMEHKPETLTDECHVLLVEPNSTRNTGEAVTGKTRTVKPL